MFPSGSSDACCVKENFSILQATYISVLMKHTFQLPAELRRLSSEDDDVIDDSVTSELTSECTDSGRGQSTRLSS
jgi:hypothetical protein